MKVTVIMNVTISMIVNVTLFNQSNVMLMIMVMVMIMVTVIVMIMFIIKLKVMLTVTAILYYYNTDETTITVKNPVSKWPVGGLIVKATTGDYVSQGQTETRRITNVNQNVITLDKPLSFQHLSVTRVTSGTTYVTMIEAEVGLLTRNVLYQGYHLMFILKDYI